MRVVRHSRRDDAHKGDWRFCPWCGEALLTRGVCRFCGGPAASYSTACDSCWLPLLAKRTLGDRTIEEVARLYVAGLSWNEIGKKLDISRPRMRGKDTLFGVKLLFEAAGEPGYVRVHGDDAGNRDRCTSALDHWLRTVAERAE